MFMADIGKKIFENVPLLLISFAIFIISTQAAGRGETKIQHDNLDLKNGIEIGVEDIAKATQADEKIKYSSMLMDFSVEVPILVYHHIDEYDKAGTIVSIGEFENHIKTLTENGYTGISFEQLINFVEGDGDLPPKPIIITFDDGYLSIYEFAYPILKKYNMKATMFIIGISVGKDTYRNTGDKKYAIIPRFSYEQAREMVKSGLISIQSHSYDMHQWVTYEEMLNGKYRDGLLPLEGESDARYREAFRNDCTLAKTELESKIGEQFTVYAYPHGSYTPANDEILREMGVKATVTLDYGSNDVIRGKPDTLYNLSRMGISGISGEKLLTNLRNNRVVIRDSEEAGEVLPRNMRWMLNESN